MLLPPLPSGPSAAADADPDSESSSQENNKENSDPSFHASISSISSSMPGSSATQNAATDDPASNAHNQSPPKAAAPSTPHPPPPLDPPPGTLPVQVIAMLDEIVSVLEGFSTGPPHTIQRLSELLLFPRKHYRSLPSWLHAVDRVVHVTSPASRYPLRLPDSSSSALGVALTTGRPNGVAKDPATVSWSNRPSNETPSSAAQGAVDSDDALGGALLTPIPWLISRGTLGSNGPSLDSDGDELSPSERDQLGTTTPGQAANATASGRQQQPGKGAAASMLRTDATETVEGPNGMGRIETVSVSVNGLGGLGASALRSVTQGELMRQEQRAGVVPSSRFAGQTSGDESVGSQGEDDEDEDHEMVDDGTHDGLVGPSEDGVAGYVPASVADSDVLPSKQPHPSGPTEIGVGDTGPQSEDAGIEAAVAPLQELEPPSGGQKSAGKQGGGPDSAGENDTSETKGDSPKAGGKRVAGDDALEEDTPRKRTRSTPEQTDVDAEATHGAERESDPSQ